MKRTIENKIRLNAILIYIIIAAVCCGMAIYAYILRDNIGLQRENIEEHYVELALTSQLIYLVHQSQTASNQYAISKSYSDLQRFQAISVEVDIVLDSLDKLSSSQAQHQRLAEIDQFLAKSRTIISEIQEQFDTYNPLDSIHRKLQDYIPNKFQEFVNITTRQDTIIRHIPKKNFWERFAYLVAPEKHADSLQSISTSMDSLLQISNDSLSSLIEIQKYSIRESKIYRERLRKIQEEIDNLINSDWEISLQLSDMLIGMYYDALTSILQEIDASESVIKKNYTIILIVSFVSLTSILVFIILILQGVNKGHTARKDLEEANRLTQRLMEERHRMLLSVSHDIKAPLSSMLGYIDVWQFDNPDEKDIPMVHSMQNSGRYILSLLGNLLEFSSLEQGTLKVSRSHFNIHELCCEISEMLLPLAQQKHLSFLYTPKIQPDIWIESDRLKLKQIIINILSNAVKYTIQGSIDFQIAYEKDKLWIAISDTGVGIPANQIKHVFEPFSRVDQHNQLAGGNGFGLYVVKGLVSLLQGDINVNSKEGKGTKFELSIPAKLVKPIRDEEEEKIEPLVSVNLGRKQKVLVVDDDATLLSVIKEMLHRLGYESDICLTLGDFEHRVQSFLSYDFVLTDLNMGVFSGVDILNRVKHVVPELPVILMTAKSNFNDINIRAKGFAGYLQKPFSLNALARILKLNQPEVVVTDEQIPHSIAFLNEMFDNDREVIKEIVTVFVTTTFPQLNALQEAIDENDFARTQMLCHKMSPSFAQLGAGEIVAPLQKMDSLRDKSPTEYPQWKEELTQFMEKAKLWIWDLKQQYNIN